jgi:hypothetical protein
MFKLPYSLDPQIAPTDVTTLIQWQLDRLHHANPSWLPAPGCGITTCPIWAIDMTGLSPVGLQLCRLLRLPSSLVQLRGALTGRNDVARFNE